MPIVFDVIVVLCVVFLFSQTVLAPFIGKRMFWLFRSSTNTANPDEKEIQRLEQEKEELNRRKRKIKLQLDTNKLNRELKLEEIENQKKIDDLDEKINKKKSAASGSAARHEPH
jgi:hypothetical protein